jgi:hypothetical protein
VTRKVIKHVIIFAVVTVLLSAIAIWLGLGPVLHSSVS